MIQSLFFHIIDLVLLLIFIVREMTVLLISVFILSHARVVVTFNNSLPLQHTQYLVVSFLWVSGLSLYHDGSCLFYLDFLLNFYKRMARLNFYNLLNIFVNFYWPFSLFAIDIWFIIFLDFLFTRLCQLCSNFFRKVTINRVYAHGGISSTFFGFSLVILCKICKILNNFKNFDFVLLRLLCLLFGVHEKTVFKV